MAVRHGTPTAPPWIVMLEAAAEWGTPPWEFAGGSPVLWFARWDALRSAKISAEQYRQSEREANKNKRKR